MLGISRFLDDCLHSLDSVWSEDDLKSAIICHYRWRQLAPLDRGSAFVHTVLMTDLIFFFNMMRMDIMHLNGLYIHLPLFSWVQKFEKNLVFHLFKFIFEFFNQENMI